MKGHPSHWNQAIRTWPTYVTPYQIRLLRGPHTLVELAADLKLTPNTIGAWELGTQYPEPHNIRALLDFARRWAKDAGMSPEAYLTKVSHARRAKRAPLRALAPRRSPIRNMPLRYPLTDE